MKKHQQQPRGPVDLGPASRVTLGAAGTVTDYVRMMEHWGISRD